MGGRGKKGWACIYKVDRKDTETHKGRSGAEIGSTVCVRGEKEEEEEEKETKKAGGRSPHQHQKEKSKQPTNGYQTPSRSPFFVSVFFSI